ncbi:serine aminopeptidase domain-containing protein [Bartonella sp. CB178]|uniref:serine aminopeptidase domain-containing protein n=1 Tax=Bartonella sp. CB178 TaxID=3112255 RepID=UPI00300E34DE
MQIPCYSTNLDSRFIHIRSGHLKTDIDSEIHFIITHPKIGKPKGTVVILKSYTNSMEEYFLSINEISKRGFCTAIFDCFNKAVPQRTTVKKRRYKNFDIQNNIKELNYFFKNIAYPICQSPYYVLSHGIGGLTALNGLSLINHKFSKMLCVSPTFAPFGNKTDSFQHKLTQFFCNTGLGFLPVIGVKKIKRKNIPLVNEESASPYLLTSPPTSRWMASVLNAIGTAKKNILSGQLQTPTMFVLASQNNITNNIEIRELCQHTRIADSITIIGADLNTIINKEYYRKQLLAAFNAFILCE